MTDSSEGLTASNIKYLLALHKLSKASEGIRCVQIAEALKLTKPSVHAMVNTLKNMELVQKDSYGMVYFTDSGRELAQRYTEYCEAISGCLKKALPDCTDVCPAAVAAMAEISPKHLDEMHRRLKAVETGCNIIYD